MGVGLNREIERGGASLREGRRRSSILPSRQGYSLPIYVINSEEYVMWRITQPRTNGINFIYAREIG